MTMTELHSLAVNPFADKWIGYCSCKWLGQVQPTYEAARNEAKSHVASALTRFRQKVANDEAP